MELQMGRSNAAHPGQFQVDEHEGWWRMAWLIGDTGLPPSSRAADVPVGLSLDAVSRMAPGL